MIKRKLNNTPGYEQVTEVKFKYKGKENEDPKLPCPPINPSKKDQEAVKRLIDDNVRHPQQRPGGKPVSTPKKVPQKQPVPVPAPKKVPQKQPVSFPNLSPLLGIGRAAASAGEFIWFIISH